MNGPSITKDGRPIVYPVNELTNVLTGSSGRGGVSSSPPPAVKSGAWGAEVMSDEERAELDAKYAQYISGATEQEVKEDRPRFEQRFSFSPKKAPLTHQPDFNKISKIDLERNVIVVDGLEFPLSQEDVQSLRLLCVNAVLNAVVHGLSNMLALSGIDERAFVGALKREVFLSGQVPGSSNEADTVQERRDLPAEGTKPESSVEQE